MTVIHVKMPGMDIKAMVMHIKKPDMHPEMVNMIWKMSEIGRKTTA
jgi:hypothetical protein